MKYNIKSKKFEIQVLVVWTSTQDNQVLKVRILHGKNKKL